MKHHFVPQFLLRRWADDGGRLRVFEIKAGKLASSTRSPQYTGYEKDLYAISGDKIGAAKHHFEETLFGPIDNGAALALAKIESKQSLSEDEHHAWTTFLCSLRVRSPDTLDYLRNEAVQRLRAKLAERDQKTLPEHWSRTETWAEQNAPGLIANFGLGLLKPMIEHPKVMLTFGRLNWWCYKFGEADPPLLLADLPLHWEGKLADPDFMIMLPIAPDRAFFGTRAEVTAEQLTGLGSAELANRLNMASVASAVQRIWARAEEPARDLISANPPSMGLNTHAFRTFMDTLEEQNRDDAAT